MLTIKGVSEKECFLTGSQKDVVDVKFQDGSFAGSIAWEELLKVMKRKGNGKIKSPFEKSGQQPEAK